MSDQETYSTAGPVCPYCKFEHTPDDPTYYDETQTEMKYGSVCSGIEAASMAWGSLGWTPAFFAEVDKFPSAVLAHHHGSNMPDEPYAGINGVPNYGDLSKFKDWPDHADLDVLVGGTPCQSFSVAGLRKGLDDPRGNLALVYLALVDRYRPRWVVWENVPGVLSSDEGRDFGSFLGALGKLGYGFSYRVLDAQYVRVDGFPYAVPQRRRRVFVVGYLGDWRRASAVLFEPEGLRGDIAPRREAGKAIAPTISARPTGGGGLGTDFDLDGGLIPDVACSLNAHGVRIDAETETLLPETSQTLLAKGNDSHDHTLDTYIAFPAEMSGTQYAAAVDVAPALSVTHTTAVAGAICRDSFTGGAGGRPEGAAAGHFIPVAFDMRGREGGAVPEGPHDTANIRAASGGSSRSYVAEPMAVRRLTPRECERLQGFPDDYTKIPYRGREADNCPDGPRYKALGNSMAVNVMRWIGQRIDLAEQVLIK